MVKGCRVPYFSGPGVTLISCGRRHGAYSYSGSEHEFNECENPSR